MVSGRGRKERSSRVPTTVPNGIKKTAKEGECSGGAHVVASLSVQEETTLFDCFSSVSPNRRSQCSRPKAYKTVCLG